MLPDDVVNDISLFDVILVSEFFAVMAAQLVHPLRVPSVMTAARTAGAALWLAVGAGVPTAKVGDPMNCDAADTTAYLTKVYL